ncbi:MAG: PhzF family phenazine biosynthesis protein [Bacteroidetes bacterium]|nr:PhzF family phenazine biosynthesis protein [Bacteroidota bacterium]
MGKKINIQQIDAFSDRPFRGNSAGVTFGDGLSDEEMQLIAREMNLAETAFLCKSSIADYNLRWFTPSTEVDLCGHATIASLHFLNSNEFLKNKSEINFDTRSGILKCKIKDERYFMQIPIFKTEIFNGKKNEFLEALGLSGNDIEKSFPFIILENGYLYIYVKNLSAIKNLKPNYKELLRLQKFYNAGGTIVFTRETFDKENFAHLRFFGSFYGIDEDPVTGSANGPLLLVLNKLGIIKIGNEEINLSFEQGDIIGRRGRIGVHFSPKDNELFISGQAITVLKGEMIF